jgi:hypothetical protein
LLFATTLLVWPGDISCVHALNATGLPAGRCRAAIQPLGPEERTRLKQILTEAGLLQVGYRLGTFGKHSDTKVSAAIAELTHQTSNVLNRNQVG